MTAKDTILTIGGFACLILVFYALIVRIVLYVKLRRRIPELRFMFATTLGYLESEYLRNRRRVGTKGLDVLMISADLSLVAAVAVVTMLFRMLPRE